MDCDLRKAQKQMWEGSNGRRRKKVNFLYTVSLKHLEKLPKWLISMTLFYLILLITPL
jgi:hypothetical protein